MRRGGRMMVPVPSSRMAALSVIALGVTVAVGGCEESGPEQLAEDTLRRVEDIRGLDSIESVPYRFESPRTAFDEILDDWLASDDLEQAQREAQVLERLGLLPLGYDVVEASVVATREAVAGFYDPQRKSITVVTDAEEPASGELMVLAHEYAHALQDQHFGFERLEEGLDADAAYALDALVEGEATLTMAVWMVKRHGIEGVEDLQLDDIPTDVMPLEDVPPVLLRAGEFPYIDGAAFVFSKWIDGEWRHIDDIWASPPVSTEQILHPERYPDDVPELVELPDIAAMLGPDWEPAHEMVLGEMVIGVLLADGEPWEIDDLDAFESPVLENAAAATGWGGDRLVHLTGPGATWLIVWQTTWDSGEDAVEFGAAVRTALDDLDYTTGVIDGADVSASGHEHPVLVLIASDPSAYSHVVRTLLPFANQDRSRVPPSAVPRLQLSVIPG